MCLGIPMKIVKINGLMATAEVTNVQREIALQLVENPRVGDWVMVHAGFAIQIIDEKEAEETIRLLEEFRIASQ